MAASGTNLKDNLASGKLSKNNGTAIPVSSEATKTCTKPTHLHNSKKNRLNCNSSTGKKPKLSNEVLTKATERTERKSPVGQEDISTKKPSIRNANDVANRKLYNLTLPSKKSTLMLGKDFDAKVENMDKRPKIQQQKMRSTSRPISTGFSVSSTFPAVSCNSKSKMTRVKSSNSLRHSWHGMPSRLNSNNGNDGRKNSSQAQQTHRLVKKDKKTKHKMTCNHEDEDFLSEDENEIVLLFPSETLRLFIGFTGWLEMAEKQLDLMETNLDEAKTSENDQLIQRTKKTFQVFKEETRLQEFKLTMIQQTCDTAIGIPGEDYRVAIRKWEVIKHRVVIHEQKLTLMAQGDGNLSRLYYWLNEAESLLESYKSLQENEGITSLKYRMERHQEIFKFLDERRHEIQELRQHCDNSASSVDEGVIWDVTQRFHRVEKSSQKATNKLTVEYYKNKVGQCIELCQEQLLDHDVKFTSQSQAEDKFHDHLVIHAVKNKKKIA